MAPIDDDVKEALIEQKEELECKIEKIEVKVENNTNKINELEKNFAVTNERLENIGKSQSNIELGQIKNREISLQNFNNMNQIVNKNTDSILALNNNFVTIMNNVLNFLTEKNIHDNITDENLNKGWNKREVIIAIIGLIGTLGTAVWAVCK